jgi:DnaD/phage-associated family protein
MLIDQLTNEINNSLVTIFPGFPSKSRSTSIPEQFFTELLRAIDHLGELKVTLYTLWRLDRMEDSTRYITHTDFTIDDDFMVGMGKTRQEAEIILVDALERATTRGTLLRATLSQPGGGTETLYFLNTPRGRAAIETIQRGDWQPDTLRESTPVQPERTNIFRMYETHIGPLTPLIADTMRDAETTYPSEWIPDAFRIAVENNVRKWRYVEAILNSWLEKGRDDRENLRDSEKERRKYTQGEFADYIEH